MAKAAASPWTTISIHPLTGPLDTRSRPADLPPGAFRWKQNFETPPAGGLRRREGFERPFADMLYDNTGAPLTDPHHPGSGVYYHNHDHHHQGTTREQITLLFQSDASDGTRRLFDGTQSRFSVLDTANGYWTDILTGKGAAGSRWKAAGLADYVITSNGYDDIYAHKLGTATAATIPDLVALKVSAAKVVVEFNGFILLMNFDQNDGSAGAPHRHSRIRWCDLNLPLSWDPAVLNSLAGFQDLDYGDEILAAAPMLGALYIYTRRSIWRCTVSGGQNSTFSFVRVYNEPKNQKGCLVYPNTLISTGSAHYYMSRESVYHYDPYIPEPERKDWLFKASGSIYSKADTKLIGVNCNAPVGEFVPIKNELWFSWPSGTNLVNNLSLVLQTDHETGDLVDHGFITFANNRRNPEGAVLCNENQDFLGVCDRDWSIKVIGADGFFARQFVALIDNDPTNDLPATSPEAVYYTEGYNSIIRGRIPLGLDDRKKYVRNVNIEDDTNEQTHPCEVVLRIGNHYQDVDANEQDPRKSPLWHDIGSLLLKNQEVLNVNQMKALRLKPSVGMDFPAYEEGRYLYYEITIRNADGSPAIGGDTAWSSINFDAMPAPKP